MKKLHFLQLFLAAILCAGVLGGCFPEGEGKDKLIPENIQMGPSGGEKLDSSAPVGPASTWAGNPTTSAFPQGQAPATGG